MAVNYIDAYIENEDPTADPYVHQKDAIDWMCHRVKEHKGALLADVMGFGKTMMACMTLAITKPRVAILVCPKSVIYHWIENILTKCKTFMVFITNTTTVTQVYLSDTGVILEGQTYPAAMLMTPTPYQKIVVCNYEAIKPVPGVPARGDLTGSQRETGADLEEYIPEFTPFNSVEWDMVICDEVHRLRNGVNTRLDPEAKRKKLLTFHRMCRLRMTPGIGVRIGLTGTPIQNRSSDIVSILKFLGAEIPIRINADSLKLLIREYMFRRTEKDLHIALRSLIRFPEHDYINHMVEVKYETQQEADLYRIIAGRIEGISIPGQQQNPYSAVVYENNPLKRHTLEIMISADINLFVKVHNQMYLTNLPFWHGSNSKHRMITDLIAQMARENESVIIFLHYYAEMHNIMWYIDGMAKHYGMDYLMGYKFFEINGEVESKQRQFVVNETKRLMQSGQRCILFANVQSASEGLNLQHFTRGIFSTTDYNPAMEEQAIGRMQRIGQSRLVHIYRFIHACVFDNLRHVDLRKEGKKEDKRDKFAEFVSNCENAAHHWPVREMPGFEGEKCIQFDLGTQYEFESGEITFETNEPQLAAIGELNIAGMVDNFYQSAPGASSTQGQIAGISTFDLSEFNTALPSVETKERDFKHVPGLPLLNKKQMQILASMPSMPDKIKVVVPSKDGSITALPTFSNPFASSVQEEKKSEREVPTRVSKSVVSSPAVVAPSGSNFGIPAPQSFQVPVEPPLAQVVPAPRAPFAVNPIVANAAENAQLRREAVEPPVAQVVPRISSLVPPSDYAIPSYIPRVPGVTAPGPSIPPIPGSQGVNQRQAQAPPANTGAMSKEEVRRLRVEAIEKRMGGGV